LDRKIENLDKKGDFSLIELNPTIEVGLAEVCCEIIEVRNEIKQTEARVMSEMKRLEAEMKGVQIEMERIESTLSAPKNGLDNELAIKIGHQALMNRGVIITTWGALHVGVAKYLFLPSFSN